MYSLSLSQLSSFSSSTSFFHRHHLSFHSLLLSGKEKYLLTFNLKYTSSQEENIREREKERRRAHHITSVICHPPLPSPRKKRKREKVFSHPSLYQKRFHLTSFSSWYNLSHEGRRRQQAWPVERNALVISLSPSFIRFSLSFFPQEEKSSSSHFLPLQL